MPYADGTGHGMLALAQMGENAMLRIVILLAGLLSLTGCGLFGETPKEHTVIDYESLEPTQYGTEGASTYRYGHTDAQHHGTGIDPKD